MAEKGDSKNWWDSQLDWSLTGSLHDTIQLSGKLLKSIPSTLSAYRLGKSAPMLDSVEPIPAEKIKAQQPNGTKQWFVGDNENAAKQSMEKGDTRKMPRIIPPPLPKPGVAPKAEAFSAESRVVKAQPDPPAPANPPEPPEVSALLGSKTLSTTYAKMLSRKAAQTHNKIVLGGTDPSGGLAGTPKSDSSATKADSSTKASVGAAPAPPAKKEECQSDEKKMTLEQLLDPDFCGYT